MMREQMRSGVRFSEAPKRFRTREAAAKSQPYDVIAVLFTYSLYMTEVRFIQEVSGVSCTP